MDTQRSLHLSDLQLHETSVGLDTIEITQMPMKERIIAGRDMNLYILLRNMQGAGPSLGDAIRELAERASEVGKDMRVLELRNGAPFSTLYFQERAIRNLGDYMLYGPKHGSHESPRVVSTVIADKDYIVEILTNTDLFPEDSSDGKDLAEFLNSFLGWPAGFRTFTQTDRLTLLRAYNEKISKGEIEFHRNNDPVDALRKQYDEGNRYDLILPDLTASVDRMNYIQAIQASLNPGGYAFIPINWWRPETRMAPRAVAYRMTLDDYKLGLDPKDMVSQEYAADHCFIDDTVVLDGKSVALEDYLVTLYPSIFSIAHYPGAKTLIIRGSTNQERLQFPEFDAKLDESKKPDLGTVSIIWTPKTAI